jgi:hypothetical protein
MTQNEMIEMATHAGFFINDNLTITSPFIEDICISPLLEGFALLVAAKEREACAKTADEWNYFPVADNIAQAIRARGEK